MSLQDDLYHTLLDSPLGVVGAEQTLPALSELLRDLRKKEFWAGKRCRLSEELMLRAWAEYRRELRELRERLRQRQQGWDDLLSWLAIFVIKHYRELARVSASDEPKFQTAFDMGTSDFPPEDALVMRDDWQNWVIDWLRDALRDTDLDELLPTVHASSSGDDSGASTPEPPLPRPEVESDDEPGIEF